MFVLSFNRIVLCANFLSRNPDNLLCMRLPLCVCLLSNIFKWKLSWTVPIIVIFLLLLAFLSIIPLFRSVFSLPLFPFDAHIFIWLLYVYCRHTIYNNELQTHRVFCIYFSIELILINNVISTNLFLATHIFDCEFMCFFFISFSPLLLLSFRLHLQNIIDNRLKIYFYTRNSLWLSEWQTFSQLMCS